MVIRESELRRLEGDPTRSRTMVGEVFCATCGYCLKTLPFLGQCPECGARYNARSLNMVGIYTSQYLRPPIGLAAGTVLTLGVGLTFLIVAATSPAAWWIALGSLFLLLGLLYLRSLIREAGRYFRSRSVEKLIEQSRREREQ